ncbi:2-polyprenylphenol 6-hydroxylase [Alphaproteobacteria bacterium]|nr:2-polyprenylphenol 6-hydroxylase [Alphaproteobacteria bacterium]
MNNLKHFLRLLWIARILAKYDCLYLLDFLGLGSFPRIFSKFIFPKPKKSIKNQRIGQRLTKMLQELGPSFIKFGQTWSTRADIIGESTANDLSELRDKIPPFSTEKAFDIIEKTFQKEIDKIFKSFEAEPIAAASIAQVHLATTIEGDDVAVKILRPNIEKAFKKDIDLFRWLAKIIDKTNPNAKRLKALKVVKKFEETCLLEMDLSFEAASASELKENFKEDKFYKVPSIFWNLTSNKVLTTERVGGFNIGNRDVLLSKGIDVEKLVENLLKSFLLQVFRDGFFHADLHPGNLFSDLEGNVLPVDFGIMGRMDRANRYFLANLMLAFLKRDYKKAAKIHLEAGYIPSNQSIENFALACRSIGESILDRPAKEVSIGKLLYQLLIISEQFQMETQPQLLLLQRTLVVAEGVARELDPQLVLWDKARKIIEDWMRDNKNIQSQVNFSFNETLSSLRRIPYIIDNLDNFLNSFSKNGIKLNQSSLKKIESSYKKSLRRHAYTISSILILLSIIIIFK